MRPTAREFFASGARDYDALHYGEGARSLMTERLARMLEAIERLQLARGAAILDAGCGPGHLMEALAARGYRVCGIDTSGEMTDRAAKRLARAGVALRLCRAEIERLPFPDASFDGVCAAGVLEYLDEDRRALLELRRVLRRGGHLVLPVTNFWSPVGYLDFGVEYLKRRGWFLRTFNRIWRRTGSPPVRARHFRVRRQRPGATRALLQELGFTLRGEVYFYFLPWPHPFDRLFPRATAALGRHMERLGASRLGPLAEGYLTVSSKG